MGCRKQTLFRICEDTDMSFQMYAAVGGAALDFINAKQEADRQDYRHAVNRIRASEAQNLKISQLNRRAIQESEYIADQKMELAIQTLQNQETRAVVGGETGLSGGSIDNFIKEPMTKKLRAFTKFNEQERNIMRQIELEKIGVTKETEDRINSVPQGQQPNFLMYAGKAALAGMAAKQPSAKEIATQQLEIQREANALIESEKFVGAMPAPSGWSSITNIFK